MTDTDLAKRLRPYIGQRVRVTPTDGGFDCYPRTLVLHRIFETRIPGKYGLRVGSPADRRSCSLWFDSVAAIEVKAPNGRFVPFPLDAHILRGDA